jgi:hypothetical protein
MLILRNHIFLNKKRFANCILILPFIVLRHKLKLRYLYSIGYRNCFQVSATKNFKFKELVEILFLGVFYFLCPNENYTMKFSDTNKAWPKILGKGLRTILEWGSSLRIFSGGGGIPLAPPIYNIKMKVCVCVCVCVYICPAACRRTHTSHHPKIWHSPWLGTKPGGDPKC